MLAKFQICCCLTLNCMYILLEQSYVYYKCSLSGCKNSKHDNIRNYVLILLPMLLGSKICAVSLLHSTQYTYHFVL